MATVDQMRQELSSAAGYSWGGTDQQVTDEYNRLAMAAKGLTLAGGLDQATLAGQNYQNAAQQQYVRDRLNQLEIPMSQAEMDQLIAGMSGYYEGKPTFTREQWDEANRQWQQQFNAGNWANITGLLGSKTGPMDWGAYSQMLPEGAFGAVAPQESWEKMLVNWFKGTNPWTGMTGAATGPTAPGAGDGGTAPGGAGGYQVPENWLGIQTAIDQWANSLSPGGMGVTGEQYYEKLKELLPGAPSSYIDSLYGLMGRNNQDPKLGSMLTGGMEWNKNPINYMQQAYDQWAPTQQQATGQQAGTQGSTTATGFPSGQAQNIPFRQPIGITPNEWQNWGPTKQAMEAGNWNYNGIVPADATRMMAAAWPTGRTAPTTTWG